MVVAIVILAQGSRFTIRHLNLIKIDLSPFYPFTFNRARKSHYERLLAKYGFEILKFEVTERFTQGDIDMITTRVPLLRETLSMEDLSCRSILFSARKTEKHIDVRSI